MSTAYLPELLLPMLPNGPLLLLTTCRARSSDLNGLTGNVVGRPGAEKDGQKCNFFRVGGTQQPRHRCTIGVCLSRQVPIKLVAFRAIWISSPWNNDLREILSEFYFRSTWNLSSILRWPSTYRRSSLRSSELVVLPRPSSA